MAHPGDVCEGWRPHFFKVFFPCYSSKRLRVPPGFLKHIQHETSRDVSLVAPSGNVWNAQLVRENDGGISFQNGWEEFVADHTLKAGDFLMFRYDGNLRFRVLIFDPTACEREDAFHVVPLEDVMILGEGRPRRRATERLGEEITILDPKTDMAIPSKNMRVRENPLEAAYRNPVKKHTNSVQNHSEEVHHSNDGSILTNEDDMDSCGDPDSVLALQTGSLRQLHNLRPELVESTGASLYRRCNCTLVDQCVHRRISTRLCQKPLNSSRCPPWKQATRGRLDTVTCEVKEEPQSDEDVNNAFSGETMLKRRRITKTEANKSHNSSGGKYKYAARKHKEPSVKRSTHKKNGSTRSSHKKNGSTKRQPCCKHSSSANSEIVNVTIMLRMGYAVSRRRPITEYDKAKTLETAMRFQSEHPFVICVMQESNVYYGYYVCLPMSFMAHLPRCSVKMKLWDPSNESWKVMYVCCEGRGGFSAGWGKFVHAHNLENYDVCLFELFKPDEVRVHIFRVVEEIVPLIWCHCGKKEVIHC